MCIVRASGGAGEVGGRVTGSGHVGVIYKNIGGSVFFTLS